MSGTLGFSQLHGTCEPYSISNGQADHQKAADQSMPESESQWLPRDRIQVGQLGDRTAVLSLLDKQGCKDQYVSV